MSELDPIETAKTVERSALDLRRMIESLERGSPHTERIDVADCMDTIEATFRALRSHYDI